MAPFFGTISPAAASDSLYIETVVPGLHALPDVLDATFRLTAVFACDQSLDQHFTPILIFLVAADQIADIFAGITEVAGFDLLFDSYQGEITQNQGVKNFKFSPHEVF